MEITNRDKKELVQIQLELIKKKSKIPYSYNQLELILEEGITKYQDIQENEELNLNLLRKLEEEYFGKKDTTSCGLANKIEMALEKYSEKMYGEKLFTKKIAKEILLNLKKTDYLINFGKKSKELLAKSLLVEEYIDEQMFEEILKAIKSV